MNQRRRSVRLVDASQISVDMVAHIATKYLTPEELTRLIGQLEQELANIAAPPEDQLIAERPRAGRV